MNPILGRDFYNGEDDPKAARTALLSYSAWQKRYGRNPNVIGQSVVLDGDTYTIIGVLPREFGFAPAEPADFWGDPETKYVPRLSRPVWRGTFEKRHRFCDCIRGHQDNCAASFEAISGFESRSGGIYAAAHRSHRGRYPVHSVVLNGAGLLLLIAGVNVANLLLVRAETRKREMAVRRALGASPRRVVTQFLTEGMLLAAIGTVLGIVGAQESIRVLAALIPKDMMMSMPYLHQLGLNGHVLAFACGLAVLVGMLFALMPITRSRPGRSGKDCLNEAAPLQARHGSIRSQPGSD